MSGQNRSCSRCSQPLSRYNPGKLCQACTTAERSAPQPTAGTVINGPRLRELRRARGIGLQLLADRAGISPAALSMLERNHRNNPAIATVTALAAALSVSPQDLLTTTPPPATPPAPRRPRKPAAASTAHSTVQAPQAPQPEDFTAIVERHMQARAMSVRATARAAGYSDHTLLSKVLNGHRPITPYLAAKLDRALGAGGEIAAAAAQAIARAGTAKGDARRPPASAGREQPTVDDDSLPADIAGLMAWVNGTNTTDDAIEQIGRAAAYLAEAHGKMPPQTVLSGVLQTHEQAQALLLGGRQRLRQTRELLRIDSFLLSHACLLLGDLGHNGRAARYGAAALALAREAGSDEAAAWSARAKTARWQQRYVESAELARRGFEAAAPSPTKVELAYREANAIALFGDASRARKALRSAETAAEELRPDPGSGNSVWSFSTARQAIFALSVAIHIGDPDSALQAAARADAAWASGEPKVPATCAQIQAGSSIACLMKDSLDGAASHIAPVLTLPPESRISTVTGYVRKLEQILAQSRFAGSPPAADLAHQIRDFISAAPPDAADR